MEGKVKLILTRQLGEVMRESAPAASSYARSFVSQGESAEHQPGVGKLDILGLVSAILLISGVLLLPGCAGEEEPKKLDFGITLPASWKIVSVARLDTNGDKENDWVILYSFDQPGHKAFTPVRCAVYHIYRREPKLPIIYPYHLAAPNWTYLGEGAERTSVGVQDIVTRIHLDPTSAQSAPQEVIVQSTNADGFVNRVSIFQWRDSVHNKLADPNEVLFVPGENRASGQWYQCIGLFEGTIRVDVQTDRVAVWDRLNDRSQLARVNTYVPTGGPGGYLSEDNQLAAPVSSCVDFAFGMPADVFQSPYPEKIVLAFQKQFRSESGSDSKFLTEDARKRRKNEANWRIFAQPDSDTVQAICVKRLSYNPATETKTEIQAFAQGSGEATTVVEAWAEYEIADEGTKKLGIEWELIRKDNVWKIDNIRSVRDIE